MPTSAPSTDSAQPFSEELTASLKALGATIRSEYATIVVDKRSFELRFFNAGRYSRAGLSIVYRTTNSRTGAPATLSTIVLREEGSADVLGKSLGINREVQLGDEAFDESVYVESAAPEADVRGVLSEKARPLVRELLRASPLLVLYEGEAVARSFVDTSDEANITPSAIESHCRAMGALVDVLPFDQAIAAPKPRRAHWLPVAIAVLAMGFGAYSLAQDSAKVARTEPLLYGFALGALCAAVLSAIAARIVRGRADSFRVATEIAAPLVVAGTLFGGVALPALNVRLDASPGDIRELRVESATVIRPSKGSPSLRVRLVATQGQAPEIDASMPTENAALFAARTLCRARLHPGRFGFAWWGELERIEPQVTPGVVGQASSQGTNAGAP